MLLLLLPRGQSGALGDCLLPSSNLLLPLVRSKARKPVLLLLQWPTSLLLVLPHVLLVLLHGLPHRDLLRCLPQRLLQQPAPAACCCVAALPAEHASTHAALPQQLP